MDSRKQSRIYSIPQITQSFVNLASTLRLINGSLQINKEIYLLDNITIKIDLRRKKLLLRNKQLIQQNVNEISLAVLVVSANLRPHSSDSLIFRWVSFLPPSFAAVHQSDRWIIMQEMHTKTAGYNVWHVARNWSFCWTRCIISFHTPCSLWYHHQWKYERPRSGRFESTDTSNYPSSHHNWNS